MGTKEENAYTLARAKVQETSKLDPEVPLSLGGRSWILVYNNWALKGIFADTGINILGVPLTSKEFSDPVLAGAVLYWGLRTRHPEVTQEEVDKLFTTRHYLYVQSQVFQALQLFYPDIEDMPKVTGEGVVEEDPTKPPVVSGSVIGPSGEV